MTELDINIDDLFADLFNDSGEPIELPPAEEAKTVDGEPIYLELEWRPRNG